MVFHGAGFCNRRNLIGMVLLCVTLSPGMGTTTAPTSNPPSTVQDLSTDEQPTVTTQAWSVDFFSKLGGSMTMIFAAILGSLLTSWIARRACPDAWTGPYCESCRNCFVSFKGRTRKKRAIVLPADEDQAIRWTVAPGPTNFRPTTPPQQPPDTNSHEGLANGAKNPIGTETNSKRKTKPSFVTISSLVSTFTVPRTDLTSIALEQMNVDKSKESSAKKEDKNEPKEIQNSNGFKNGKGVELTKTSKESLIEDDSSLANGAVVSKTDKSSAAEEEISYDENEPLKQPQLREVVVETHASPSIRYENEIIDPREAAKLDSPSQRSETYSSDFESSTTHVTPESGLYSESPIRTIYEEVKS